MRFTSKLSEDPDYIRAAKYRIANDLFKFTFAAVTNSFGAAAWVLFHAIRNTNVKWNRRSHSRRTQDASR